MARLQELLEERGISKKWFLEQAGSLDAGEWRKRRPQGNGDPRHYIDAAIQWKSVPYPEAFRWADLVVVWLRSAPHERWPELEAVMGWCDPLEAELLEVKNG